MTMKRQRRFKKALCAALVLMAAVPVNAQSSKRSADLVLVNGEVKAGDGWGQAIAVSHGLIVGIGTNEAMRALAGPGATMIDLQGKTVLPGLIDSHVHPLFAGLEQYACRLAPGAAPTAIRATLAACVAAARPGEWVKGGNWVAATFKPGEQDRAFLDAVALDNPVLLNDEAHHSIWVNSRALAVAGIGRDTPDPRGGIIERDAQGMPTGLLRETATRLIADILPPATLVERRDALILATNQMLSFGITSFTVASVRDADMTPLSDLSSEGLIKQRMRGCIVWAPPGLPDHDSGERLIAQRGFFAQPRFKLDCVKLFLDGVPTESHTGAMLASYIDGDGDQARPVKGVLMIPPAVLDAAVTRFDRAGLSIKFHAAGDAAVREAIDAVAAAHAANGFGGPVHDVAHATFVDPADIPRVAGVQMAWEFSPYIWYPTPIASVDIMKAVGIARMARWIPIAEAVRTGALVVAGSDWSVVPSVNPWLALETMVTRQRPGGSRETLGAGEAVSLDTAFRIITVNASRLMG